MKYRIKHIDAVRFWPSRVYWPNVKQKRNGFWVDLSGCWQKIEEGDYVVNNRFIFKPHIFEAMYERA